ncbi:Glycosyltransferase family 92 protein [Caenorhabditis elegans]|uniref:Glycosyltransferase family 92 protein n=1 Tax=Caenorhabditis elegans TaxID=6239 RepID=O76399_CAEEL|nr:Glycosyltransferase family 92 protein [Caenorhabditis elegans]CCD69871.2 Glycosyltransferase family 92 protein [Caenorhabditis elegans]|eukprot:NP_503567.2 Uncharacterized protein CELE_F36F12.2 [Caenorhabditis elegans]
MKFQTSEYLKPYVLPITVSFRQLPKYRYRLHPLRALKLGLALSVIIIFSSLLFLSSDGPPEPEISILQSTHTFIHSAYYYPSSKSLGKNAIAMVTTMNKRTVSNITNLKINLIGTNKTDKWMQQATLTTEHGLHTRCDYSLVTAHANLLEDMEKLEIESDGVLVEVPVKRPKYSAPKPVVFCIAPQFAAEQWQTFLVQLHVSKRYGAHLQLYVVSMVESYFNLLKEHEKLGLVSIEPWLTIKFSTTDEPYLEPNRNVELRNQAAAHTDCILMYKEAVSFIGVLDMDDILIPTNANSYYEEFEREYAGSWEISALHYDKFDYKTIKTSVLDSKKTLNISSMIKNSKRLKTKDEGKSFFRPERLNSTWSHYSLNSDDRPIYLTKKQRKPIYRKMKYIYNNGIFHLKHMVFVNSSNVREGVIPINPGDNITELISERHLKEIDEDFLSTISQPEFTSLTSSLPKDDFYTNIVFQCYNQSFYHIRDAGLLSAESTCVNAFDCELSQREAMPCTHSDATYHSGPPMFPITFHWASDAFFSDEIGCYQ